jgi:hypothetical protein
MSHKDLIEKRNKAIKNLLKRRLFNVLRESFGSTIDELRIQIKNAIKEFIYDGKILENYTMSVDKKIVTYASYSRPNIKPTFIQRSILITKK